MPREEAKEITLLSQELIIKGSEHIVSELLLQRSSGANEGLGADLISNSVINCS